MISPFKVFTLAITLAISLITATWVVGFHENKTTVDITDEGWFLIMSPDLKMITELCANVGGRPGYRALGCSWWDPPEPLPAKRCLMIVYTGNPKTHKDSPQIILDHEYRHCSEGYFKENHK